MSGLCILSHSLNLFRIPRCVQIKEIPHNWVWFQDEFPQQKPKDCNEHSHNCKTQYKINHIFGRHEAEKVIQKVLQKVLSSNELHRKQIFPFFGFAQQIFISRGLNILNVLSCWSQSPTHSEVRKSHKKKKWKSNRGS